MVRIRPFASCCDRDYSCQGSAVAGFTCGISEKSIGIVIAWIVELLTPWWALTFLLLLLAVLVLVTVAGGGSSAACFMGSEHVSDAWQAANDPFARSWLADWAGGQPSAIPHPQL